MNLMKTTALLLLGTISSLFAQTGDPYCLEFESIAAGDYTVGQSIAEDGILMTFAAYTDGNGNINASGFGTIIDPAGLPVDQELRFNNINIDIPLTCAHSARLSYRFFGGNINLGVNGDLMSGFAPANGSFTLGGVNVTISGGTMTFTEGAQQIGTIRIGGQEFFIDDLCWVSCDRPNEDCFDFEQLDDTKFGVGETITEDGQLLTVRPYTTPDGDIINGGLVSRNVPGIAGHLGQDAFLNNASLAILYDCVSSIKVNYFDQGDGIYLVINGEEKVASDPSELDGATLGGVQISVISTTGPGGERGLLCLDGYITDFTIGGQKLFLDHLCAEPCREECVDFEAPNVGTVFADGSTFSEDGLNFGIIGGMRIENAQAAGHFGKDAHFERGGFKVEFGCANQVSFHYGQYDSEIQIQIDGKSAEVSDMTDLDGQTLANVTISVTSQTVPGGITGIVTLTGKMNSLVLQGRELWIDHLCHTPCPDPDCLDFELEPLDRSFTNGQSFVEDGLTLRVGSFTFGNGTTTTSGSVNIKGNNRARHIRHEANLSNATLNWRYNCVQQVTFNYAEFGGSVNLIIDGQLANANNMIDLHGTTLGGAAISVSAVAVPGGVAGRVTLTGIMQRLGVGGQEFWIDHVCHVPCPDEDCIDYEELPANAIYQVADNTGFVEDGVTMKLRRFNTGTSSLQGSIRVDDQQRAGHIGQDLRFSNANLAFVSPAECFQNVSFYYGDYGGLVNLQINDSPIMVMNDLMDFDGMTFGGSNVTVTELAVPGGKIGRVQISGVVTKFMVGGQEFFIDHWCFDPCDPISVGPVVMTQGEVLGNGNIATTYEVTVTGPGVLTPQKSEDLGVSDPWSLDPNAVVIPLGGGLYEIETVVPAVTPDHLFHRFKVETGNP